jgi:YesN/AraC family two-component response regulator
VTGEAENGAQLLYMLQSMPEEKYPNIVLLDINMPVMDGIETLKRLKEQHQSVKVIILTMHENASMVSKMMSLGANSYVPKTEASDQIAKAIVSVHNSDYFFNELTNRAIIESVRNGQFVEESKEVQAKNEEVKEENVGFSWKNKVLLGAVYGVTFAVIISIVIYLIYKISGVMSAFRSISPENIFIREIVTYDTKRC